MTSLMCTRTGQPVSLVQQIASSGEGEIWRTTRPGYLAKIYYSPRPERIQKLEVMIAHPPQDPNAHINHISFAWPYSLLQDRAGALGTPVGFLMPEVANAVDLLSVYSPLRRQMLLPEFNWLYLHATAMNIASLVWAIHHAGYVLGDLKPQNILVNNAALPSIIDTDSFQVRHPHTGELFRCPVGSEGFTPAELMDQDLASIEQTEVHDRFRLGVILYLLLFGDHPFKGQWIGPGDSPDPNELLRQGWWPYAPSSPIQPSLLTVPLNIVHPDLQQYFLRCFNAGHHNPTLRPTAAEWVRGFKGAIADLKRCRKVKTHYLSVSTQGCYWCARKAKLGIDVFAQPPKTAKTPLEKALQRITTTVEPLNRELQKQVAEDFWQSQSGMLKTFDLWQDRIEKAWARTSVTTTPQSVLHKIQDWINTRPLMVYPSQLKPSERLGSWAIGIGCIGIGLLGAATALNASETKAETIDLTFVGSALCLALIGISVVLAKFSAKVRD